MKIGVLGLMCTTLFFGLRQHPSSFDDAYITYRYARNIALGRGFVYNIGEPVLGTTTPLYAVLLAGLSLIWPDIPLLSHHIGVLAWMLCVPVIYGIGRVGEHETVGITAAVFIATNALFLNVLGMETTLYVLLVLLTFYLYLKGRTNWAVLCAGLAFVTRWDGILAVGTLLFAEVLRNKGTFLKAGSICALTIIPWLVYSYVNFGSIFPNTFFAKLGQGWNEGLGSVEIGSFGRGLLLTANSAYKTNCLFLLMPILGMTGLFSVFYYKVKWWPLLLWTAIYTGGYIALGVLRFSWYYPPLMPGLVLLAAGGIKAVAQFVSSCLKWSAGQRFVLAAAFCTLCLIPNVDWLVKSQRTGIGAHSTTYVEVGRWLNTHTPSDSSVALLEIGIIGFYSDRTVVDTMGLVSPEMVGHLGNWLQTLQFAVNYYWPDYVVGLKGTGWDGVVHEPWFQEAYALETQIENSADPIAPVSIYRRRNEFPLREFALDSSPELRFDQVLELRRVQVAEDHIRQADRLHVQLTWEAEARISVDYRFRFDLVSTADGQRWKLMDDLQPMHGGNPTMQWRNGDRIVDSHSLMMPGEVPAGTYELQVIVTQEGVATPVSGPEGAPVGNTGTGPIDVTAREPNCSMVATWDDSIRLVGYDLDKTGAGNLALTLYWEATGSVSRDYTAFVHLLSPEGELAAQHDSPPLRSTSLWISGTREIDMCVVALPPELPLTDYQIRVGWYHWPDLERVPIVAPGDLDAANNTLFLGYVFLGDLQSLGDLNCPHIRWIER